MNTKEISSAIEKLLFYIEQLSELNELLDMTNEQLENKSLEQEKCRARTKLLSKEFCSSAECYLEIIQGEIKRLHQSADNL